MNPEDALYTTLTMYAKTLGTRSVAALCQRFILDSFPVEQKPVEELKVPQTPEPHPPLVEPPPIKRVKLLVKKRQAMPPGSPEAKEALKQSVEPKQPPNRDFAKLVEKGFLPEGTLLYPSAPDPINPDTAGIVIRKPTGQPAIQATWDKNLSFTGKSSPPIRFLTEAKKRFPTLKMYVKANAWDDVLYKHKDGSFRVLSDVCCNLR